MAILNISYFADTDTLSLWNGKAANSAGDLAITDQERKDQMTVMDEIYKPSPDDVIQRDCRWGEPVDVIVDYREYDDGSGEVVGFTIEHAAALLLRPLERHAATFESIEIDGRYAATNLVAGFAMRNSTPRTDYVLRIEDGELRLDIRGVEATRSYDVGEYVGDGFTARLRADEDADYDCVGFELTHAVDALLPYLTTSGAEEAVKVDEAQGIITDFTAENARLACENEWLTSERERLIRENARLDAVIDRIAQGASGRNEVESG